MIKDIEKVRPFDSFSAVCRILVWAGYYEPLNPLTSSLQRISWQSYRILVLLFSAVYNLQHLLFLVQHRDDMAKILDCLVIEIPQLNMFVKCLNMLVQTTRINKIQQVLTGPIFAVTNKQDEIILKKNILEMNRLNTFLIGGITVSGIFWFSSLFVKRYNDNNEVVNSYMPFKTDTWPKFTLSVFIECSPLLWIAYGHICLDQLIAAYYAHAQAQLKIIKNQLERFCPNFEYNGVKMYTGHLKYKDLTDDTVYKRFVDIVKRYETLVWYKNEVDYVFNFPLSFQFFSTGSVMCLVIFRMTAVNVASFLFLFLTGLFFILLTQVFMYCYYGNLVEFESCLLNDSVFKSNWLSLSPPFRRSLLVAMSRWSRPIQPRVCGIIPLSLNTFFQIVKSSYTLYTVLVVAAKPDTN